ARDGAHLNAGPPAGGLDLLGRRLGGRLVAEAIDDDRRALLGQVERDHTPDVLGAARHDRCRAPQPPVRLHGGMIRYREFRGLPRLRRGDPEHWGAWGPFRGPHVHWPRVHDRAADPSDARRALSRIPRHRWARLRWHTA